jgi:hypothetical protein
VVGYLPSNKALGSIPRTGRKAERSAEVKIKARAHKGDMRTGKTPKKLASICCPQCRETKADTLKATEANGRRGPGTREKVRSRRINLEGNTHAQEIILSQLPV